MPVGKLSAIEHMGWQAKAPAPHVVRGRTENRQEMYKLRLRRAHGFGFITGNGGLRGCQPGDRYPVG
jgi:hypothetical protein